MSIGPTALGRTTSARFRFRVAVGAAMKLAPRARYGVAVAAAAATVLVMVLRLWLNPGWGHAFPFLLCMPAIMLSGWIGGGGPGLVTTLLCATAAYYWLLEPAGSWQLNDKTELLGIVLLLGVGTVISALNEAWRRSVGALGRSEQQLHATLERERAAHEAEQAARRAAETAAEELRVALASGKRTEKVLRARTEELERVLEVIPASVWIAKDPGCREVVWNRNAASMLGLAADQPLSPARAQDGKGMPVRYLRDGHELSPEQLPLQQAAASGRAQPAEEIEIELSNGCRLAMIGSAAPLMDEHGQVRGAVAAYSDITERKQADRQKDEFLALLGHELRNPLSPIGAATEWLARTLPADSRTQAALDIIKRQATQLSRLVDDLLDIGRITQGRIQLQQAPLDLSSVVAQALETVEPRLRQKQHDICLLGSEAPLFVRGDFARLVQCVGNILANAVKYTEPRGRIRIETRAEDDMAVIRVADNGTGIPAELLPKVFDLFVQGDRTLDRAEGGLGIGLAVVKKLIQMQGGTVAAESAGPGRGATIEIRLPRIARPATSAAPLSGSCEVSPQRILIVDDNADAAESLAMLLGMAAHEVVVAFGGVQALEVLGSFRPEAALIDIGLPEIDGYELARRVRADEGLSGIKLIAVTGYGQAEDRQRALAAGFDHHLVKPVDVGALERALASTARDTRCDMATRARMLPAPYRASAPP